jgi:hypothetical protein
LQNAVFIRCVTSLGLIGVERRAKITRRKFTVYYFSVAPDAERVRHAVDVVEP